MGKKDMSERVAIVTGASSGIGAAIARAFAEAEIKTVLAARSTDKLDAIVAEIRDKGGTARASPTDVTNEAQVVRLFADTMAAYGRVDILVNNAGIADHIPTVDLTLAEWQRSIDVMLTGPFLCGREAMRVMMKQKRGRIINIGSVCRAARGRTRSAMPRRNSAFTASPSRWRSTGASTASRSRSSIRA